MVKVTREQHNACVEWAKALRSGDYEQGSGYLVRLNRGDTGIGATYCCLGVACHLDQPDLSPPELVDYLRKYSEGEADRFGSLMTANWPEGMEAKYGMPVEVRNMLATANDRGVPFGTIASMVEVWSRVSYWGS